LEAARRSRRRPAGDWHAGRWIGGGCFRSCFRDTTGVDRGGCTALPRSSSWPALTRGARTQRSTCWPRARPPAGCGSSARPAGGGAHHADKRREPSDRRHSGCADECLSPLERSWPRVGPEPNRPGDRQATLCERKTEGSGEAEKCRGKTSGLRPEPRGAPAPRVGRPRTMAGRSWLR
jgi:hypothetical protein